MGLPADKLRSVVSAYRLSQLVHACASLGIPDALAEGRRSSDQIAEAIGAPSPTVARLMRAAASEGVFDFGDGGFALNPFSEQLRSDGGNSARDFVLGWPLLRPGYMGFAFLDDAVRTQRSGIQAMSGQDFHEYMRTHPDDAERYRAAMESTVEEFGQAADAYDFSRFKRIVDVGGGRGAFLLAILSRNHDARGVLFDLPEVVAGAPAVIAGCPDSERIEVTAGDMFQDVPAGGDAYIFSTVLRCFPDDRCVQVLRNCRERMAPGGCVLAVEMLMDDGIPASPKGLADLQALVVYGGMDRTRTEWGDLFGAAGFSQPSFLPTGDGAFYFVEARGADK